MSSRPAVGRRVLILTAVLAGLASIGAAPVGTPSEAKADPRTVAVQKAMLTPRLYHLAITSDAPNPLDGVDMCVGKGPILNMIAKLSEDPEARAALDKGCTHSHERKEDGSVRMELNCDKAAGATYTSRFSMHGTVDDMHQHAEVVVDLGPGQARTMTTDTRMTYLGDCPPAMKPGQLRRANGEIFDPLAGLAALSTDAEVKKGAPPGK